ncbi:type II toxin-antitoxin system HicA family toxin [Caldalkalibacillus thermarum TA2.A1]|uniref:Type II toxin-antitoxin system HicA family toxin n=1 Tax=Caldalkalibacillus thermarum (strain TA2.A1) TaxID=986075 RepID=A0A8X8I3D3_CALTT|nr:type II toxin-antitoxin system HicA family toxin [Caldalkalibacillus thermarum]QZT33666.1 type II toxin-antitoxin system HicA family toxin [Caldalkalibacillus thermarum TA2.A1]
MPPLPIISGKEAIKIFLKAGFEIKRQKGSHVHLVKGKYHITIPLHDQIKRGTLRSAIRQAGMTVEDFLSHME